jgi:hypothetical protein
MVVFTARHGWVPAKENHKPPPFGSFAPLVQQPIDTPPFLSSSTDPQPSKRRAGRRKLVGPQRHGDFVLLPSTMTGLPSLDIKWPPQPIPSPILSLASARKKSSSSAITKPLPSRTPAALPLEQQAMPPVRGACCWTPPVWLTLASTSTA